jgi:hypothetical protein
MLELAVPSFRNDQPPAVCLEEANDIPYLHEISMSRIFA